MKRLGLTGATGYIGTSLVAWANTQGWSVVALGRRRAGDASEWRYADLAELPSPELLDGLDAIIHLAAYTGSGNNPGHAAELAFAQALAAQARERGMRGVFVSSQAAAETAPSDYGRSKFAIEQAVRTLGMVVVRPGMVVGGPEAGLFGLLCSLVRRSPVLPMLLPAPSIQPVHVDDLSMALLSAASTPGLEGRVLAVAGPPLTFAAFLGLLARLRLRVHRIALPVPVAVLRLGLRVLRPLTGGRMAPERLDSLVGLPKLDADADLRDLAVALRPVEEMLARRSRPTREWLREAHALARVFTVAPTPALLRRYVRLLALRGIPSPLYLPPVALAWPSLLAALDTPGVRSAAAKGSLAWRLNAMLRLAEAAPESAPLLLALPGQAGRWRFLVDVVRAMSRECRARCIAPLARRWVERAG